MIIARVFHSVKKEFKGTHLLITYTWLRTKTAQCIGILSGFAWMLLLGVPERYKIYNTSSLIISFPESSGNTFLLQKSTFSIFVMFLFKQYTLTSHNQLYASPFPLAKHLLTCYTKHANGSFTILQQPIFSQRGPDILYSVWIFLSGWHFKVFGIY